MKKIIILASIIVSLLIAVFSINALAQSKQVVFRVKEKAYPHEPIAGATITIRGTILGGVTDSDGVVIINGVLPTHVFDVTCVGYIPFSDTVGTGTVFNIELEEDC